jgi:hypothetical protein
MEYSGTVCSGRLRGHPSSNFYEVEKFPKHDLGGPPLSQSGCLSNHESETNFLAVYVNEVTDDSPWSPHLVRCIRKPALTTLLNLCHIYSSKTAESISRMTCSMNPIVRNRCLLTPSLSMYERYCSGSSKEVCLTLSCTRTFKDKDAFNYPDSLALYCG